MTYPKGCSVARNSKVQGQCDAPACNYPFCEASETGRLRTSQPNIQTNVPKSDVAKQIREAFVGSLNDGVPNHTDHTKRGFTPK